MNTQCTLCIYFSPSRVTVNLVGIDKTDREWQRELSPEEYRITRQKGTEPAFTGQYWNTKQHGTYVCRCCGAELFSSDAKYDSGCGWPSFFRPLNGSVIDEHEDLTHGMVRTERKSAPRNLC
ncbi:peptide-methionine (R)-S-oxide reductase [Klebsiella pneumoniae]